MQEEKKGDDDEDEEEEEEEEEEELVQAQYPNASSSVQAYSYAQLS